MDLSINMVKDKELEYIYYHHLVKGMENGFLVNSMVVEKMYMMVKALIGGSARIINMKDMEHGRILKEPDILGKILVTTSTDMEYSDILMDQYIMESGKMIKETA
jgi:hypothetical protein